MGKSRSETSSGVALAAPTSPESVTATTASAVPGVRNLNRGRGAGASIGSNSLSGSLVLDGVGYVTPVQVLEHAISLARPFPLLAGRLLRAFGPGFDPRREQPEWWWKTLASYLESGAGDW